MADIIRKVCDVCAGDSDTEVPGVAVTVGFDADPPVRVDLCDEHWTRLVEPLRAVLAEFGHRDSAPKVAAAAAWPCPGCGRSYGSRASLGEHARKVHGSSVGELLGEPPGPRQVELPCPECGKTCRGPNGLGLHRRWAHAVVGARSDRAVS